MTDNKPKGLRQSYELRPKNRRVCDLRECLEQLDPHTEYPVLHGNDKYFSGVRVFCSFDHLDEYEMRVVLMRTRPPRGDPKVPGVVYRHGKPYPDDHGQEIPE